MPVIDKRPEGTVTVPEVIVKSVVEALALKVQEPEFRNSTLPRADDPVRVPERVCEVPVKKSVVAAFEVKVLELE